MVIKSLKLTFSITCFMLQDYEDFDAANDEDKVKVMLKLEEDSNVDGDGNWLRACFIKTSWED